MMQDMQIRMIMEDMKIPIMMMQFIEKIGITIEIDLEMIEWIPETIHIIVEDIWILTIINILEPLNSLMKEILTNILLTIMRNSIKII